MEAGFTLFDSGKHVRHGVLIDKVSKIDGFNSFLTFCRPPFALYIYTLFILGLESLHLGFAILRAGDYCVIC